MELCRHLGEKLGLKDGEQVQRHSEQFVFCDSTCLLSVAPQALEVFVFTDGLCCFPQGFLRSCHQTSSVHQVFVEPLTSDDWEILVGEPRGQNILLLTELNHYKGFCKSLLCLNVCLFPTGVG